MDMLRPKWHTLNMFKRVAVVSPKVKIGSPMVNAQEHVNVLKRLYSKGVQAAVFPELSLTGHSIGHLLYHEKIHSGTKDALKYILEQTKDWNIFFVLGAPWQSWGMNFNVQIACHKGKVIAMIPKQHLTSTAEYDEKKFFASGDDATGVEVWWNGMTIPFLMHVIVEFPEEENLSFGFSNCEDDWGTNGKGQLALINGATVIMHSNASSDFVGKASFKRSLLSVLSGLGFGAWLYAAAGPWESGRNFIYSGRSFIYDRGSETAETANWSFETEFAISDVDVDASIQDKMRTSSFATRARLLNNNPRFTRIRIEGLLGPLEDNIQFVYSDVYRNIPQKPFVPSNPADLAEMCEEVWGILSTSIIRRLLHTGQSKVELAWSGGMDSFTCIVALLKALEQMGYPSENLIAVTMPHSKSTSEQTLRNVYAVADAFHLTLKDVPIDEPVRFVKDSIENDLGHEITALVHGNIKALFRKHYVLMDSSAENALEIGTGTNSEIGVGWDTLFADSVGRFSVIQTIFKTMSQHLLAYARDVWYSDDPAKQEAITMILEDTPQSAELEDLGPHGEIIQETEKILGKVDLRDFFLWGILRFGRSPLKLAWYANQAYRDLYPPTYIKAVLYIFLTRHFGNIFKARTRCDGPATGSATMDPNNMYDVPSDMKSDYWVGRDMDDEWDLIPSDIEVDSLEKAHEIVKSFVF